LPAGKDCILTEDEVLVAAHLLPTPLPVNQRMQAPAEPLYRRVMLYHQAVPSRRISKQEAPKNQYVV
jgi:hypothetical protein